MITDKPVITEDQLRESFNLALDEQDLIKIGTLEYLPSVVLEAVDPIAYRIGLSEHADFLMEEGNIRTEGYTD